MSVDSEALTQLLDKEAIRDVLIRYARGIDRIDEDLIGSVYHEGAYDDHGGLSGPAIDFVHRPARHSASHRMGHHLLGQSAIDLRGDTAFVETYQIYHGLEAPADEPEQLIIMVGRYLDRMERRDGKWAIVYRRVVMDLTEQRPIGAPHPTAASYVPGRRFPDDEVYRIDTLGE